MSSRSKTNVTGRFFPAVRYLVKLDCVARIHMVIVVSGQMIVTMHLIVLDENKTSRVLENLSYSIMY